jgi:hypothetical protein
MLNSTYCIFTRLNKNRSVSSIIYVILLGCCLNTEEAYAYSLSVSIMRDHLTFYVPSCGVVSIRDFR